MLNIFIINDMATYSLNVLYGIGDEKNTTKNFLTVSSNTW